ncbi:MAG: Type 1 glutamine amidotransferase-like domain-containing protein [Acidobacteriota bacterium]|nr:Type 1 glutamine amidotransferase-like domain-containing protein [Acidobacteriota bacterium]
MKLLLTSNGITNQSIEEALVDLLEKPIGESRALFVPTGMYPFPGGGVMALEAARGRPNSPLSDLPWKAVGLLELTALTTIQRESWVPILEQTDALLVWGGNVMYLNYWLRASGVAEILPTLENLTYVGVSAGSIVTTTHNCDFESNLAWVPEGSDMALAPEQTLGLVDFTMWVHLDNPNPIFADHTVANVQQWARDVPVPTYIIDDQTAIKVRGDHVDVISDGNWQRFAPFGASPLA